MWKRIKKKFRYWNLIRCTCGSRLTRNTDHLQDGPYLVEYAVCCSNCGAVVNHWAYGSYEFPQTYTEALYRATVLRVQHKWWQWKILRDMNRRFPKKKFRSKSLGPQ